MNIFEKKAVEEEIRLEAWYEATTKKLPLKADTIVQKDVPYLDANNERHTFDVYYKEHGEKLPVIFDFHGGGFISGNKKYNQWYSEYMAEQGFLVFTFAYPLVFEKNLYGILRDCYEGMKTAFGRLEELGGDPERIYLGGDSAGGYLATCLAAANNDADLAAAIGIERIDMKIRAAGVISALFYCSRVDQNAIFLMRKLLLGKDWRKHPFRNYINPEKELYKALPPMFGITSDGDFLQSYTLKFIQFLQKQGKQASLYSYDNRKLEHDFVCLNPDYEESKDALNRLAQFFRSNC